MVGASAQPRGVSQAQYQSWAAVPTGGVCHRTLRRHGDGTKAAAQGNAWAQAQLGRLYAVGRGVPQDFAAARGWYEKAAAQGNAWARGSGWRCCSQRAGGPQDYGAGTAVVGERGVTGNPPAQVHLGWLYELSQYVSQNNVRAGMWFQPGWSKWK